MIQTVVTPKDELAYRIIDLDSYNIENPVLVGDYEADETKVKVAEFTERFTKHHENINTIPAINAD